MSETATPAREIPADEYAGLLKLLEKGGREVVSRVEGSSMGGTLPAATRIRIRAIAPEEYRPGLVVAVATPTGLVAHRIVTRGKRSLARGFVITRGDDCVTCDPPVAVRTIAGVVTDRWQQDRWEPVPPMPAQGMTRRVIAGMARLAPSLALEIDARLALWINVALVHTSGIFVWLGRGHPSQRP